MSQQPFSRPGAIDLSALKRPAPAAPPSTGGPGGGPGAAAGGAGAAGATGGAYSVQVSEENFQATVEASMTAPVLLLFYSATQDPASVTMAADVARAVEDYDGRYLAGLVDIDAAPSIAQAMQIPQVPLMLVILEGRPATQPIPGVLSADELSTLLQQLGQQLTTQGITGRHQPRHATASAAGEQAPDEDAVDPRFVPAEEALMAGDAARAVAEYEKLVTANPADHEAVAGLARARILHRTDGVDLNAAREAAAADPADLDAQRLVADLDLLGGHVDDAFARLIALVRRTSGEDRNTVREHLVGLFAAVGNDDPRVLKARQHLASALF